MADNVVSVSQSVVSRTEIAVTMRWATDDTVDLVWFSSDGGSSWTMAGSLEGTGGSYLISGLSPDTAYTVITRVRSKETQLTTDSSPLAVSTYPLPYANDTPDFTIGGKLTIGLFNPLGRNVSVLLLGSDNSQIQSDITSGTSVSGYNTADAQNRLYASIPRSQSGVYTVVVSYAGNVSTKKGGTYSVNPAVCSPSIGSVAYADVNPTTLAITGDALDIVRNQSVVLLSASGLSAKNGASVASCAAEINGNTYLLTKSETSASGGNTPIDSAENLDAVFTVTDSRGLSASKTITVKMSDWFAPTAFVTLSRRQNFDSVADLTVKANYAAIGGNNQITIAYEATKEGDSTPTISGTAQDGVTVSVTLDNAFAWTVKVSITDSLGGTSESTAFVSSGIPILFIDRKKRSIGVNCYPSEDHSVEINGVSVMRSVMTRDLSADVSSPIGNTTMYISLDQDVSVGGKLAAGANGAIVIGKNVNAVLASARCYYTASASGRRYIRIIKRNVGAAADSVVALCQHDFAGSGGENLVITPTLVSVQEGDVIQLAAYFLNTADSVSGSTAGAAVTSLTVETVS